MDTNENFFSEIWRSFKAPWKHLSFNLYFFIIVVIIGGIDIFYALCEQWYDNFSNPSDIAKNMAAFSLAIIAASLIDVTLSPKILNRVSLIVISITVTLLAMFLFNKSYEIKSFWCLVPSTISWIMGLFIWVLANSDNERLRDETFVKEMRGTGHGENW